MLRAAGDGAAYVGAAETSARVYLVRNSMASGDDDGRLDEIYMFFKHFNQR